MTYVDIERKQPVKTVYPENITLWFWLPTKKYVRKYHTKSEVVNHYIHELLDQGFPLGSCGQYFTIKKALEALNKACLTWARKKI